LFDIIPDFGIFSWRKPSNILPKSGIIRDFLIVDIMAFSFGGTNGGKQSVACYVINDRPGGEFFHTFAQQKKRGYEGLKE